MAISLPHFQILKELHSRGVLPQGGAILEIGEANWYGDADPQDVWKLAGETCDPSDRFAVVKLLYKALFNPSSMTAIDAAGPTAIKADLNDPVTFTSQFDTTYNHGTAEHIFNISQVFKTMHDATKVGGLLIHESPFLGWVDHGFYCLQPTLFYDVAAANKYERVFVATEHLKSQSWQEIESREHLHQLRKRDQLGDDLMLYVVMRKTVDAPFAVPMQGVYAATVSKEVERSWKELR